MNSASRATSFYSSQIFNRWLILLGLSASALAAQTVEPPPAPAQSAAAAKEGDEKAAVAMSPFEVTSTSDVGYQANETLAGSRMNTELKDIATQVTVMTPQFLQDLAVTSLDDAIRYSLNTENDSEIIEVTAPGNAGISATTRPFNGGGRTRGLSAPNRGHDFFDTFVPIDTYNTERITFSSGPNSILFGNSSPSGTIDTTFNRAMTNRSKYSVTYRADDNGSNRVSLDLNQPIIPNMLALRVDALRDRDHDWREPAFSNQDRIYGNLVFTPFKKLTVRAYIESVSALSNPVRNTLLQDHVTPWVNVGSPAFNNGGNGAFPAVPPVFIRQDQVVPVYSLSGSGVVGPVGPLGNTVLTQGYAATTPSPNNFERSIIDQNLYPYDRNFSGNANASQYTSWIRGATLEFNPIENLYIEAGFNQEQLKQHGVDFFNNAAAFLYVDANKYLNDRATPNPNYGRYFLQDTVPINQKNFGSKEQGRVSVSYELDFTKHDNWSKWFGRHRFAMLFDHLDSQTITEESDFQVVGTNSFTTNSADSRTINFRYYLDPKSQTVSLPFNPLSDGLITLPGAVDANGNPVKIGAWDPSVKPEAPETTRSIVNSRAFAMQNYFLSDKIVFSYGVRRDEVNIQDAPTQGANSNFLAMAQGPLPWQTVRSGAPTTELKSLVVHPLSWLSLFYSESNSEQVPTSIVRNLDGSIATFGSGKGKEYGLTLRWSDKITFRLSKYTTTAQGTLSSQRTPRPTATISGKGNIIRNDVANIENTVRLAGAPLSTTYAYYDQELARQVPGGGNAGAGFQSTFDLLADQVAEGYEATVIGNPTRNLSLSISLAKNEAKENNIGEQYFAFIKERLPVWANYLNTPVKATPGITIGQLLPIAMQSWNYIRQSEGLINPLDRKYRVTATARYAFDHDFLRGFFFGGNYVWRSPAAVGYQVKTITDNEFATPGVSTGTMVVNDLTRPVLGGSLTSFDAFLGYSHQIFHNRMLWRIQLNVRNILNAQDLLVQRALSTGDGAIYTAQEPRSFILSNTFEF